MTPNALAPLLLTLAPALQDPAGTRPDGPERGELGTLYPQPADVRADEAVVHQDAVGGARQTLLDLAGGPGGFAAVWQDSRAGMLGLHAGSLAPDGEPTGFEAPLNLPRTSRQLEPSVAVAPDGSGVAVWIGLAHGAPPVLLRSFRAGDGGFTGHPVPLGTPGAGAENARAGGRAGGRLRSGVGLDARGGGRVAWREGRAVRTVAFLPGPRLLGEPAGLGDGAPPALGAVAAASTADGRHAVAYDAPGGVALFVLDEAGARAAGTVPGGLVELLADPRGDAFWLLSDDGGAARVRVVGADGAARAERVLAEGPLRRSDLAVGGDAVALVAQEVGDLGPRLLGGEVTLRWFDRELAPTGEPAPLFGEEALWAGDPLVAAGGGAFLVGWTDERDGSPDVWYRLVRPGSLEGADRRWNTDGPSSNQTDPAVAANAESALVVWEDWRYGRPEVWGRRIDRDGAFAGDEFLVSDPGLAGRAVSPAAALDPAGRALVAWFQTDGGRERVLARVLEPDGRPAGEPFEVDPGEAAEYGAPSALVALPGGAGFALCWLRAGPEGAVRPVARRYGADGEPRGAARPVGAPADGPARNPALGVLDDGRLVAAWDVKPARGRLRVEGRLLAADLAPLGDVLRFPATPHGVGDWGPSVAPAAGGGFLLAWTGNEAPTRDVFACFFDAEGAAESRVLQLSVLHNEQDFPVALRLDDGTHVVVWEDDISGYDDVIARAVRADGTLGPRVTVHRRETAYVPDRTGPHAAAFDGGWLVAWADRRRSLGQDVYLRFLGPRFDALR